MVIITDHTEQPVSHLDILEGRFLYATLHRGRLIIGMAETLWVGKTEEPHFLLGLQEHTTGCVPAFLPGTLSLPFQTRYLQGLHAGSWAPSINKWKRAASCRMGLGLTTKYIRTCGKWNKGPAPV